MPHEDTSVRKLEKVRHYLLDPGLPRKHLIGDACQLGDRLGQRPSGVDERRKTFGHPALHDLRGTDLDDPVQLGIQPRRLKVEGDIGMLQELRRGKRLGLSEEVDLCAADIGLGKDDMIAGRHRL